MLFVLDDERPSRSALDACLATFTLVTLLLLRLDTSSTSFPLACAHARLPRPLRSSPRNGKRPRWLRGWRARPRRPGYLPSREVSQGEAALVIGRGGTEPNLDHPASEEASGTPNLAGAWKEVMNDLLTIVCIAIAAALIVPEFVVAMRGPPRQGRPQLRSPTYLADRL